MLVEFCIDIEKNKLYKWFLLFCKSVVYGFFCFREVLIGHIDI